MLCKGNVQHSHVIEMSWKHFERKKKKAFEIDPSRELCDENSFESNPD